MRLPESSEMFLKYDYAETKDLCKHFLTLVTAVLTFSEKIVDYRNATPLAKYLLLARRIMFLVAIIACGVGLVYMCLAGGGRYFEYNRPSTRSPEHTLYGVAFKRSVRRATLTGSSGAASTSTTRSAITMRSCVVVRGFEDTSVAQRPMRDHPERRVQPVRTTDEMSLISVPPSSLSGDGRW